MRSSEKDNKGDEPVSYKNVALPLKAPYKFPDRCISCSKENPEHKYKYDTFPLSKIFGSVVGDSYLLNIPCCKGCAGSFHVKKVLPDYLMLAVFLTAPILAVYLHKSSYSPLLVFGLIPALALIILVLVFLHQKRNKVLEVFVHGETVIYSYKDEKLAKEFFELNKSLIEKSKE